MKSLQVANEGEAGFPWLVLDKLVGKKVANGGRPEENPQVMFRHKFLDDARLSRSGIACGRRNGGSVRRNDCFDHHTRQRAGEYNQPHFEP